MAAISVVLHLLEHVICESHCEPRYRLRDFAYRPRLYVNYSLLNAYNVICLCTVQCKYNLCLSQCKRKPSYGRHVLKKKNRPRETKIKEGRKEERNKARKK
jgi:hypothetical protein